MFKRITFALAMIAFVTMSVIAQPQAGSGVTQEMRTAANEAYQKQNWAEAAKNFEAIIKLEPKNGGAHYRQGISYLNISKNDDALRVLAHVAIGAHRLKSVNTNPSRSTVAPVSIGIACENIGPR